MNNKIKEFVLNNLDFEDIFLTAILNENIPFEKITDLIPEFVELFNQRTAPMETLYTITIYLKQIKAAVNDKLYFKFIGKYLEICADYFYFEENFSETDEMVNEKIQEEAIECINSRNAFELVYLWEQLKDSYNYEIPREVQNIINGAEYLLWISNKKKAGAWRYL